MTTEPGQKDIMIEAKLRGPGPGRYGLPTTCGTEKHDFTQQRKPAFTFGKRFNENDKVASPGPVYLVKGKTCVLKTLYKLIIQLRSPESVKKAHQNIHNWVDDQTYLHLKPLDPVAMKTTPVFLKVRDTLIIRFLSVLSGERHSAKYSMGDRTKYRKCDAYPSPNSYSLPQLIGPKIPSKQASNAYSMTSRRQIGSFDQDLARTPGSAR